MDTRKGRMLLALFCSVFVFCMMPRLFCAQARSYNIVLLGDSITDQLRRTTFVENYFEANNIKVNITNLGVSATSTYDWVVSWNSGTTHFPHGVFYDSALPTIQALAQDPATRPDLVVVMFGMNDSNYVRAFGTLHNGLPSATYKSYLQQMIASIGLLNIPVVLDEVHNPDLNRISQKQWNQHSLDLLAEYRLAQRDLIGPGVFTGMTNAVDYFAANPLFLADGIHPQLGQKGQNVEANMRVRAWLPYILALP